MNVGLSALFLEDRRHHRSPALLSTCTVSNRSGSTTVTFLRPSNGDLNSVKRGFTYLLGRACDSTSVVVMGACRTPLSVAMQTKLLPQQVVLLRVADALRLSSHFFSIFSHSEVSSKGLTVVGNLIHARGCSLSHLLSPDPGPQRRVPDKNDGAAAGQALYDGDYQHEEEPGQDRDC